MDEKELLMHLLTKAYGLTEAELGEKLYEDGTLSTSAADTLIEMDAKRVLKVKDSIDKTSIFDDAYKKAKKDEWDKFEKKFKETYSIESDAIGFELINELIEKVKVKPETTEDDVKIHPAYINLERDVSKRYEIALRKAEDDLKEYKDDIEKNTLMSSVMSEVEQIFISLNPNLSENPIKAKNQKDMFLSQFSSFKYEPVDGKYVVMENGKRMEDKHGNPIYLDSFVTSMTNENFDIRVQENVDGAGNRNTPGTTVKPIKTKEEYNKAISECKSDEELLEVKANFDANKEN